MHPRIQVRRLILDVLLSESSLEPLPTCLTQSSTLNEKKNEVKRRNISAHTTFSGQRAGALYFILKKKLQGTAPVIVV